MKAFAPTFAQLYVGGQPVCLFLHDDSLDPTSTIQGLKTSFPDKLNRIIQRAHLEDYVQVIGSRLFAVTQTKRRVVFSPAEELAEYVVEGSAIKPSLDRNSIKEEIKPYLSFVAEMSSLMYDLCPPPQVGPPPHVGRAAPPRAGGELADDVTSNTGQINDDYIVIGVHLNICIKPAAAAATLLAMEVVLNRLLHECRVQGLCAVASDNWTGLIPYTFESQMVGAEDAMNGLPEMTEEMFDAMPSSVFFNQTGFLAQQAPEAGGASAAAGSLFNSMDMAMFVPTQSAHLMELFDQQVSAPVRAVLNSSNKPRRISNGVVSAEHNIERLPLSRIGSYINKLEVVLPSHVELQPPGIMDEDAPTLEHPFYAQPPSLHDINTVRVVQADAVAPLKYGDSKLAQLALQNDKGQYSWFLSPYRPTFRFVHTFVFVIFVMVLVSRIMALVDTTDMNDKAVQQELRWLSPLVYNCAAGQTWNSKGPWKDSNFHPRLMPTQEVLTQKKNHPEVLLRAFYWANAPVVSEADEALLTKRMVARHHLNWWARYGIVVYGHGQGVSTSVKFAHRNWQNKANELALLYNEVWPWSKDAPTKVPVSKMDVRHIQAAMRVEHVEEPTCATPLDGFDSEVYLLPTFVTPLKVSW